MDSKELNLTVLRTSNEAFDLAKQFGSANADQGGLKKQAEALNQRLNELLPLVQSASASDQPTLNMAWSDARLDVGYILSDGKLPTSTRLYYYLEDVKRAAT